MDSPSPPPAPDYAGAAQQTAQGNLEMARYQTDANRIDQHTPWGSLTYSNTPTFDQAGYDRAMADWRTAGSVAANRPDQNAYMRDNWTQNVSLDPRLQNALNSQLAVQQGRSDQANDMLGNVRDAYNQPFNAPSWNDYLSGVGSVDTTRQGSVGDFSSNARVTTRPNMSGVDAVDQSNIAYMGNFGSGARVDTNLTDDLRGTRALNQEFGTFSGNGNGVNVNAPQFTNARQDEYAKAAYEAQMGLLRGDLASQEERTNNRLALQGLTPGSEASDNALGSFYDARSRQLNSLANQSVLTGNQMSNNDYQSQLAGFQAGNAAVGQRFGQNLAGFTTNRDTSVAENAARGQSFGQALEAFNTRNAANQQRYNMDSNTFLNNMQARSLNNTLQQGRNAAQNQAFTQQLALAQFGNQAAGQQFAQDQATYDANIRGNQADLTSQQAYNQAIAQQYAQALQNYGTNWQQAQTLRNMPLNELNALLTGQQVQNPQFENYALQQYTGGADMLGAAQLTGQYNTNVYNAQAANQSGMFGSLAGLAGGVFGAAGAAGGFGALFSDKRLKDNVEKVGETPGGRAIYQWDWNRKAEEVGADKQPSIGLIAQENLDIAKKGKRGYLMLDYSKAA